MAKSGAIPVERQAADSEPDAAMTAAPPGEQCHQGDDALVAMFNRVRDELVSTLMYMLGNSDDAQDVAQETFLKCWRARQSVCDVQNLRAWIFRIGLNAAKDFQRSAWNRKARPLPEEEIMTAGREDGSTISLENQETLDRLRVAIAELRLEEKEVFLLRQNGELTYEEIAEIRSAPVGTVKTQMRTALIKLRKVLNPNEDLTSGGR
jgi:RNA polymerase sigma-70 factor (ECF subfamily)